MLSFRLFRPGVPQGREEKAFLSIKWRIHLIEGAVQQPHHTTIIAALQLRHRALSRGFTAVTCHRSSPVRGGDNRIRPKKAIWQNPASLSSLLSSARS